MLPMTCDASKVTYEPTQTLVVVPLDSVISSGQSSSLTSRELYYEFAYMRKLGLSPFHAVIVNGDMYSQVCDFPDIMSSIKIGLPKGAYVVGIVGDMPSEMQEIINYYKITSLKEAELELIPSQKGVEVQVINIKDCTSLCRELQPSKEGYESRTYSVEVVDVAYDEIIQQKADLVVQIKVKNLSDFPIYGDGKVPVEVYIQSGKSSKFYNVSWITPTLIARNNEPLIPGQSGVVKFTLTAPLIAGDYKETVIVKVGGKQIGKSYPISWKVENNGLKLARVLSRNGAVFANVRVTPGYYTKIVAKVDVGSLVIVKEYKDEWVKIETKDGVVGWVFKPLLRPIN